MTREEIVEAIANNKMIPYINPDFLPGIVDFVLDNYSPFLPSDLDEAAKEEADDLLAYMKIDGDMIYLPTAKVLMIALARFGAEWMAGQGVTEEYDVDEDGIFLDSDSLGVCLMAYPPSELGCKEGDILVIQMRKKQ